MILLFYILCQDGMKNLNILYFRLDISDFFMYNIVVTNILTKGKVILWQIITQMDMMTRK
jgi:hypothetical protein